MTKIDRDEAERLGLISHEPESERDRRMREYLDASEDLAELMREAGMDPDVPPTCTCGRLLCRKAARNEEGHTDMPL